MTQQPATAATTISAGTLVYLFGDRALPPAGTFGATEVPSGGRVSAADLSAFVFAVSFWNLRQTGALTLEPVIRKSLGMFKTHHVQVALGPDVVQKSGYEDLIMRGVAAGASTAYDVVHGWFGQDSDDPDATVLAVATREMLQFGLAREVDSGRGAIGGFFLGRSRVEPDAQAIAGRWSAFEAAHAAWLDFRQGEPEVADTLLENCRKAIRNRQESADFD